MNLSNHGAPGVVARCVLLGAGVALAGCSASASQNWRPTPDLTTPAWKFTGFQSAFGDTTISINDETVMTGKVSVWDGEGEMAGTYQGLPVSARCKRGRSSKIKTACAITIDGRKATTLNFRK